MNLRSSLLCGHCFCVLAYRVIYNLFSVGLDLRLCYPDQVGEESKRTSLPLSGGAQALSPRNSLVLTAPVFIKKGDKGFGFRFKAVRVYIGESDDYRLHHIVEVRTCVCVCTRVLA